MIRYFVMRLLLVVPTLVAVIGINFVVVRLAPGGPLRKLAAVLASEGRRLAPVAARLTQPPPRATQAPGTQTAPGCCGYSHRPRIHSQRSWRQAQWPRI